MKKSLRVVSWLALDMIFVNMAFYTAYLIRFRGVIDPPALYPYLYLWPHISFTHLIVFSIFKLYQPPDRLSKKHLFINTFYASTVSTLTSISIVYTMRHFYGFIPSAVFAFALAFNII